MLRLLYDICIHFIFLYHLPKIIYRMLKTGKYRHSFIRRLRPLSQDLFERDKKKKLIWMHGVSVGEIKALEPLVSRYHRKGNYQIVVSAITETGLAEAKKSLKGALAYLYLPFDLPYLVAPVIEKYPPDLLILSEGDYWFNFLSDAKRVGASIIVINGKISQRSFERMKMVPFFIKKIFSFIDIFCLQGQAYFNRFKDLGISPSKLMICGNIKLDAPVNIMGEK